MQLTSLHLTALIPAKEPSAFKLGLAFSAGSHLFLAVACKALISSQTVTASVEQVALKYFSQRVPSTEEH